MAIKRIALAKLFDMLYTPAEIAEEIGFNKRRFKRVYLPADCPHSYDIQRPYLDQW